MAAACVFPAGTVKISGIVDSKIISEEDRERLYEEIITTPGVLWHAAVISPAVIDTINILQATMLGMKVSTEHVIYCKCSIDGHVPLLPFVLPILTACAYLVDLRSHNEGCDKRSWRRSDVCVFHTSDVQESIEAVHEQCGSVSTASALIDGNRVPAELKIEAKAIIKGDGSEYCIAAASILAKVTRDRIMRRYHEQYPQYNFIQHKGYGTAAHMAAIAQHGPCEIHRMTFRPIRKD